MKNGMNYESEVEMILFESIQKKFHINDTIKAYYYLKFRTYCINNSYNFKDKELLIKTLMNELFITKMEYKGVKLNLSYSQENSISNIIDVKEDELNRNKEYNNDKYKQKIINKINEYANTELQKYKKDAYYDYYKTYFLLLKLNEIFGITEINEVPDIYGFHQSDSRINKELECKRYIHFANFNTDNLNSITEKDLEEYLIKNIEVIEPELKVITNQFKISEGIIDILALDKKENYVIIELKIAVDKSMIWQCMYYPDELKELFKTRKVRMITIAPEYPDYMLKPLKKIKGIECFRYSATLSNHKVKNLKLIPVSLR